MPADKCYTKKNKNGGNYTTCVDKKGDQLREKDVKPKKKKRLYIKKPAVKTRPKPPPPPGMSQADADVMVKDVLNYNKISSATQDYEADVSEYDRILSATTSYNTNNVSDYNKILTATTEYEARQNTTTTAPLQNVSAHMSALSASAPTAPPANYNMLRPEIRKNILQFAGNPKKVIEEKILVDINLRKEIKTRVINSVLEDMNKSLKELNINTSTPIYNADMRRKMKALGKGFAVGGSNSRDIYEILDDVERALGIDEYMRFLPKVEERLEGVVKQRKQRQARERAEAGKIKKQQKAEADAEAAALGDDDKREFDTIKSVRDYLKWDKNFAKKVNEMAKVGLEKDGNRFDNSLVKVKNFLLNELYRVVFSSEGGRHSYNEMKALINSDRNKKIIFNPAWGRYKLYNF